MTTRMLGALRHVLTSREADSRGDAELLQCFLAGGDEEAFAALVRRHGPMVLGVCRRLLGHAQDAEDAFQATFLVLARKARSIVRRERLGPWLYGVAVRTARKARGRAARCRTAESQVAAMKPETLDTEATVPDWQPLFDRELQALPEKYRVPLLLCELQGLTRREAARQLRISEGTLSSRLARGRQLLRRRLGKLGFAEGASVLSAAIPVGLVSSTSRAAALLAAGKAAVGLVPAGVLSLTEGVLKSMVISQCKCGLAVLVLAGVLGGIGSRLGGGLEAAPPGDNIPADGRTRADASRADTPLFMTTSEEELQGTWRVVGWREAGEDASDEFKDGELTFRFNRGQVFLTKSGGKDAGTNEGTYEVDAESRPKRICLHVSFALPTRPKEERKVQRWAGIFDVKGDRLRLCLRYDDEKPGHAPVDPPAYFRADKGDTAMLMALERVQPRPGLPPPQTEENKPLGADDSTLRGAWKMLSVSINGQNFDVSRPGACVIQFNSGRVTQTQDGQSCTGTYTINASTDPKSIDLHCVIPRPDGGLDRQIAMHTAGIFKREGDRLTICVSTVADPERPPTRFRAEKGDDSLLMVLERVKSPPLYAPQRKPENATDDDPALWGAWKVVSISTFVERPDGSGDMTRELLLNGEEIYWRFEKGQVVQSWGHSSNPPPIKGEYVVDLKASPHEIDLRSQLIQRREGMAKPNGPYLGIYKVDGHRLALLFGLRKREPGPRPRDFHLQPGAGFYAVELERATPSPQPALLGVDKASPPVAIVGDIAITREELGEYLIERYGAEKLELLVNKRIVELACARKGIAVTRQEVDAALDEDLKVIKQSREEFARYVLQQHGKTFLEWKEDVIKPRLLLQKLGHASIRAADEDLRREFESRYGKKVRVRVLIWPKGTPEAQVKQEYEQLLQNVEKVKESARRMAWGSLEANGDRLFDVPRYAWPEDSQGQRIADIAFRLKPGELSSPFPVGEETYALQCVGHVPPVEGKQFDEEKATLLKETLEKKISAGFPKLFESLRREAKPELLLKKE